MTETGNMVERLRRIIERQREWTVSSGYVMPIPIAINDVEALLAVVEAAQKYVDLNLGYDPTLQPLADRLTALHTHASDEV
jgi:hypothetical protein